MRQIDVFHLLIKVRLLPLNVHRLRETICPMTCARARAWKSVGCFANVTSVTAYNTGYR